MNLPFRVTTISSGSPTSPAQGGVVGRLRQFSLPFPECCCFALPTPSLVAGLSGGGALRRLYMAGVAV